MQKVQITVTESNCRCGYHQAGDSFIIGDLCPPLCHELWSCAYPLVYALQNGAILDYGDRKAPAFDIRCPDQGRVVIHGECIEE